MQIHQGPVNTVGVVLNLLYIMDCMCALGAMGTASYDRSKGYASFIPLFGSPCTGHVVTYLLFYPVLSSAFFNTPELSRILWAVLDSTLSLLSICRSFVGV